MSGEFAPVRDEQRTIAATWKISVDRLSKGALDVLRESSIGECGYGETPVFLKSLFLVQKGLVRDIS